MQCTTHGVKVKSCMSDLSSNNLIEHNFHVKNSKGDSSIVYKMIIGWDLMVWIVLLVNLKCNTLTLYGTTVPTKQSVIRPGKNNITKNYIQWVVIYISHLSSTNEATENIFKILDSTYQRSDLENVFSSTTQLNSKEINCYLCY